MRADDPAQTPSHGWWPSACGFCHPSRRNSHAGLRGVLMDGGCERNRAVNKRRNRTAHVETLVDYRSPCLYDRYDATKRLHIHQWITVDEDEVGMHSGSHHANLALAPHRLRRAACG